MTVYFDKDNYINFLKAIDKSDKAKDALRMLKRQLNVHMNFSSEEMTEAEQIMMEEFQDGVARDFKLTHSVDKIVRPLKKTSFPSTSGVYLLNDDEVDKIKSLKTYHIGKLNEETDVLCAMIINDDYSFHKVKEIGHGITPANHLDIFDLPFSTLVIVDRYMFKGPEIGGNVSLFDYNLDHVLRKIYSNKRDASSIVFIYQVNIKVATNHPLYDTGPDLDKLARKIKNVVPAHCKAPEIYLIGVPNGHIDDEHDRYIFSNFLKIKSGDSFVYFSSTGTKLTKSSTVDFYSLAYKEYRDIRTNLIAKLNSIVQQAVTNHSKYCKVPVGCTGVSIIDFS